MASQEPPVRQLRAGDADRQRVVSVIERAHAAGRLTADEMTERRERAARTVHLDELPGLIDDLPEHEGWTLLPAVADPATVPQPVARDDALPASAPSDGGFTVTAMSRRDVTLEPGTTGLGNFAWWGGNSYDLTRAMGPGRTVTLNLSAVMAGSDVFVPRGVRVVDRSIAIMAGNDIDPPAQGDGSNGTLVIKGFLWWAGNSVKLADGA